MKHIDTKIVLATICLWIMLSHYFRKHYSEYNRVTTLIVENKNKHPIDVYLSLGAVPDKDTSKWIQNVHGIFGITQFGVSGKFTLQPNEKLKYTPPAQKALQGNICFGRKPINCPSGTTLVEFCINNQFTVNDAQETCEISCVAGVSFLTSVEFKGGGVWSANLTGLDTIKMIHNDLIGRNSGLPGVYPYGCDNCTASFNPPKCTKGKNEKPQKQAICNIQRNALNGGGYLKINFWKKIK